VNFIRFHFKQSLLSYFKSFESTQFFENFSAVFHDFLLMFYSIEKRYLFNCLIFVLKFLFN